VLSCWIERTALRINIGNVAVKDGTGERLESSSVRPTMRGAYVSVASPCRMAYNGVTRMELRRWQADHG